MFKANSKKSLSAILFVAVFACLSLVACGGETETAPAADSTVVAPVTVDSPAAPAVIDTTKMDTGTTKPVVPPNGN